MGRKAKTPAAGTPEPKATVTRRSTRRGRDSESEEQQLAAPLPPAVNYCEDSPGDSHSEDDYSPSKKKSPKRGGRRGRGSRATAASSGSDREAAAVRTPRSRGGGRGRRGGSLLAGSPVDLSVVMERSVVDEEQEEEEQAEVENKSASQQAANKGECRNPSKHVLLILFFSLQN